MLCPKCGTENQEQAEVCINCDEKLTQSQEDNGANNTIETAEAKQVTETEMDKESRETIEWGTDKPKPRITNIDFRSEQSKNKPVVTPIQNIAILLSSIILPIIGIAMGFSYLRKQHPDDNKAGKNWLKVGIIVLLIQGLIAMWFLVMSKAN
ncbi:MAG: zinc ribbon domain-containing protein [Nitrosomonas sp.]|nr:zinc ribbon domain-containing protein [Nitrosomonas sp.]